ncbi:Hypothetical protein POVR1_LOCUS337 [uncultured virus]|nr:Hypothetical protein POVR1_LOCUS337 [uncultured virus]
METAIVQNKLDALQILIKLYNSLDSLRNQSNSLWGEMKLSKLVKAQQSEELDKIMKLLDHAKF